MVIDASTRQVVTMIPPGPGSAGAGAVSSIAVDPTGKAVYSGDSGGVVSVIDTAANSVTATLQGSGVLLGLWPASAPGRETFYSILSSNGTVRGIPWGAPGDLPVPGDYDGDRRTDATVFRPREAGQEGVWYVLRSSDAGVVCQQWGSVSLGDQPVPADYDGDGRADLAVWRAAGSLQGVWYVLRSSDNQPMTGQWGNSSDVPVPADYAGDGRADIAVWRPISGEWFIVRSRDASVFSQPLGRVTDVPVPADYDGDGRADIAVWRPVSGEWFIAGSATGTLTSIPFGAPGDVPVPADYDGDGRADLAVWRPATGEWFIRNSRDGAITSRPWGAAGDVPTAADFDGDRKSDLTVYRP
jgi:YVTN family beta-propeller protein